MIDEALAVAAEQVADRWSLLIVAALLEGPRRFSDLQAELDGIAPNTLSSRLSQLEREELVVATPYQQRPERYAYELTDAGRELQDVVRALRGWAASRRGEGPPRHETCGQPLRLDWFCAHCGHRSAAPGEETVHL